MIIIQVVVGQANEIMIEERIQQEIANDIKSELHAKNKITKIGILDVPVLRCTSDVIN
jgi:hypothetical protein